MWRRAARPSRIERSRLLFVSSAHGGTVSGIGRSHLKARIKQERVEERMPTSWTPPMQHCARSNCTVRTIGAYRQGGFQSGTSAGALSSGGVLADRIPPDRKAA